LRAAGVLFLNNVVHWCVSAILVFWFLDVQFPCDLVKVQPSFYFALALNFFLLIEEWNHVHE
jgi:hypothetical protein